MCVELVLFMEIGEGVFKPFEDLHLFSACVWRKWVVERIGELDEVDGFHSRRGWCGGIWRVGERGRIMIAYHRCGPKNGGIKALLEYFGAGSRLAMKCATLCEVELRFHRGCFMGT